ncbi:hypothetical protein AWZ03_015110, partial [Drosophila navojoa]
ISTTAAQLQSCRAAQLGIVRALDMGPLLGIAFNAY